MSTAILLFSTAVLFVTSLCDVQVPRQTSAIASHCEGSLCNLVFGVKNIPNKIQTTSAPEVSKENLLPVLRILTGLSAVIQQEKLRNQERNNNHDKQITDLVNVVRTLVNNTKLYRNKVKEEIGKLKRHLIRLNGMVTGVTPSGVIVRTLETPDLSSAAAVDCAALYLAGVNVSGVYVLQPDPTDNRTRFPALCDMETDGGGWTVIQRRQYGNEDFFRGWKSYREGFGDLHHDFWLGLRNIHLLTKFGNNKMKFDLHDWNNQTRQSSFDFVNIADEADSFRILAGGYHGTAGDPFHTPHFGDRMQSMRFSTFDNDNDMNPKTSCARTFSSGWWFNNCFVVNPNGIWYPSPTYGGKIPNGIIWNLWHSKGYSLKRTEIKLRPEHF